MSPESRKAYFAKKNLWSKDSYKVVKTKDKKGDVEYLAKYVFTEHLESNKGNDNVRIFYGGGKSPELALVHLEKFVNKRINKVVAGMSPLNENAITFGNKTYHIERESVSPYRKHIMVESDSKTRKVVSVTKLDESSYL